METIELIKRSGSTIWWSIDVTTMPLEKLLEIIVSEKGDDYQVKRAPGRVVDECLQQMVDRHKRGQK